ncbi:MAG: Calx-beta domain-containing protein, partial [Flavobacteriales bacterium]
MTARINSRCPGLIARTALMLGLLLNSVTGWAQINLSNAAPTATQNFDGMNATLTLPASWRMHASTAAPTYAGASGSVTQQASSGSPVTGGTYNWGTSGTERAVGALTSSGFASPNSLMAFFSNTGTTNITSISVAYQAERYRVNTAAASVQFFYSTDGSAWSPITAGDIAAASFPTGANVYNFSPGLTVPVSAFSITSLAIIPTGSFYLRWNINTTGSNSQGIGIDDVSVTATFVGATPTVGFAAASSSVVEGGTASIGVTMNSSPASNVVVTVVDAGTGTATSGTDYTTFSSTQLTFTPGSYPQTQNVSIATTDDPNAEASETVNLTLSHTGPANAGTVGHALTITDNDTPTVGFAASTSSVTEGAV